jgi:hypothetical protein
MSLLLAICVAGAIEGEWRSHTKHDFINEVGGTDSALYLATAGGVAVVEGGPGQPWTSRRLTNSEGLPVNRCLSVLADSAGNLWVGTDGGGLAFVPAESGAARPYRPSDLATRVRVLLRHGDRLLAGTDQGLYVIDTRGTPDEFGDDTIRRFTVVRIPDLLSDNVMSLFENGGYWIGTNRGVTRVDTAFGAWTPFRRPLGDSVRAMARFEDSVIVLTEAGIARKGSTGFAPLVRFRKVKTVFDIAVAGADVYVAAIDGFFKVDTLDTAGLVLLHATDARSILFGEATVWLGTGGDEAWGWGLNYVSSGQSWRGYSCGGLVSSNVNDLTSAADGSVYACHFSNMVSRVRPEGWVEVLWDPLPNGVMCRPDSRGRIWFVHFAANGGLSVFDPVTYEWRTTQWGQSSDWNVIQAFGLDRYDTKWMFNKAGAVVAVDDAGGQAVFSFPELVSPPGGNYQFAFDSRGRAWLGLTVGLEMIDFGGTLHDPSDDRHALYASGLPSPEVRSVAVDAQDRVWVATPQGAAVWDGSNFRLYTAENTGGRLLSDNLYRVVVDEADRAWFLSEQGVSVCDLVSGQWQSFTPQNSGLIANSQAINGFYTGLDVNNALNEVVVGTRRGMSVFRLASLPDTGSFEFSVFPNPCVLGVHDRVAIGNLPADARVRVYTLAGEPVADLAAQAGLGRAVWQPRGVAAGLYVFVVSCSRGVRTGRLALVRP